MPPSSCMMTRGDNGQAGGRGGEIVNERAWGGFQMTRGRMRVMSYCERLGLTNPYVPVRGGTFAKERARFQKLRQLHLMATTTFTSWNLQDQKARMRNFLRGRRDHDLSHTNMYRRAIWALFLPRRDTGRLGRSILFPRRQRCNLWDSQLIVVMLYSKWAGVAFSESLTCANSEVNREDAACKPMEGVQAHCD